MKSPANCSARKSRISSSCSRSRSSSSTAANGSSKSSSGGPGDERPSQRGAHLHAAGELVREVLLEAGQARQGRAPPASARAAPSSGRRRARRRARRSARGCATRAGSAAGTRSREERPGRTTRPDVSRSRPAMMRSTVDLPHPDGPTRVRNSPRAEVEVDALDGQRAVRPGLADAAQPEHRGAGNVGGRIVDPAAKLARSIPRLLEAHAWAQRPIFGSMNLFVTIVAGVTFGSAVLTSLPNVEWKSAITFCTRARLKLPSVLSGPLLMILYWSALLVAEREQRHRQRPERLHARDDVDHRPCSSAVGVLDVVDLRLLDDRHELLEARGELGEPALLDRQAREVRVVARLADEDDADVTPVLLDLAASGGTGSRSRTPAAAATCRRRSASSCRRSCRRTTTRGRGPSRSGTGRS